MNKKIKDNEEKIHREQKINVEQAQLINKIGKLHEGRIDNLVKLKDDAFEDIEFLKQVIDTMKGTEAAMENDINLLQTYESTIESKIESHQIDIGEIKIHFTTIDEAKRGLLDKTDKLKSDIDVINARMEELESISSKGVDALENSFDVLIDSLGSARN